MAGQGKRRSRAQLTRDRRRIGDLYLQGRIQADIAAELGVSQSTVSLDLKALQRDWLASALVDFNEAKAKELAKVDRLEREYWAAWERSREKAESETRRQSGKVKQFADDGKTLFVSEQPAATTRTAKTRTGDPRFLNGVQWCIDKRCKILGIEAPTKIAPTDPTGEKEYIGFTDTERLARIRALIKAERQGE